jgi:hypothetical protein
MALLRQAFRALRPATSVVLTAALWLAPAAPSRGQDLSLERAVKAAYLYKLAPFIDWPRQAFAGAASPFMICIAGPDPFGPLLDRVVANQQVGDRPIVVRRLPAADPQAGCQIMYLGGGPAQVRVALRTLRDAPVLTVTDDPAAPGMVDLVVDQGRVRFRIDDEAAAAVNLTISSKLLSLALSVKARNQSGAKP